LVEAASFEQTGIERRTQGFRHDDPCRIQMGRIQQIILSLTDRGWYAQQCAAGLIKPLIPDLTACDRIGSPVRRQRSVINGFDRDVGWSVDTQ